MGKILNSKYDNSKFKSALQQELNSSYFSQTNNSLRDKFSEKFATSISNTISSYKQKHSQIDEANDQQKQGLEKIILPYSNFAQSVQKASTDSEKKLTNFLFLHATNNDGKYTEIIENEIKKENYNFTVHISEQALKNTTPAFINSKTLPYIVDIINTHKTEENVVGGIIDKMARQFPFTSHMFDFVDSAELDAISNYIDKKSADKKEVTAAEASMRLVIANSKQDFSNVPEAVIKQATQTMRDFVSSDVNKSNFQRAIALKGLDELNKKNINNEEKAKILFNTFNAVNHIIDLECDSVKSIYNSGILLNVNARHIIDQELQKQCTKPSYDGANTTLYDVESINKHLNHYRDVVDVITDCNKDKKGIGTKLIESGHTNLVQNACNSRVYDALMEVQEAKEGNADFIIKRYNEVADTIDMNNDIGACAIYTATAAMGKGNKTIGKEFFEGVINGTRLERFDQTVSEHQKTPDDKAVEFLKNKALRKDIYKDRYIELMNNQHMEIQNQNEDLIPESEEEQNSSQPLEVKNEDQTIKLSYDNAPHTIINSEINDKFKNVNSTNALYDCIVALQKDNYLEDDGVKLQVCLQLNDLCEGDLFKTLEAFDTYLQNSDKNEIGDKKDIKNAVLDIILTACECEDSGELFNNIMISDQINNKHKTELTKRFITENVNNSEISLSSWCVDKFGYLLGSTLDCKEEQQKEEIEKVQQSFVDGINQALIVTKRSDNLCRELIDYCDNGDIVGVDLLSKVASKQFSHIEDRSIIEDTIGTLIYSDVDYAQNKLSEDTSLGNFVPTIYNFFNSLDNETQQKESCRYLADIIERENISEDYGKIGQILLRCKQISDTQGTDTYDKLIIGIVDNIEDPGTFKSLIYNIMNEKVVEQGEVKEGEKQKANIHDVAVDLYHRLSQKQSVDKPITDFGMSEILEDTGLKKYIQENKKDEYEIIYDNILTGAKNRNIAKILEKIPLSQKERNAIMQQMNLLATPEEVFDFLDSTIKNNNTLVNAGLANERVDLLNSSDRAVIRQQFEEKDLYSIFTGSKSKESDKARGEFYNQLDKYVEDMDVPWYYNRWMSDRNAAKKEAQNIVKTLRKKDEEFKKNRNTLNEFGRMHFIKAKEAATYIAQYEFYKKIIKNEDGKFSRDYIVQAKQGLKRLAKQSYPFDSRRHGVLKKTIWGLFGFRENRLYRNAKYALEKSNKALAVMYGTNIEVAEYSPGQKSCYNIKYDVVPDENNRTIKSKKLRALVQDAGIPWWAQWRRSRHYKGSISRTEESTAIEQRTKKFIEETSEKRARGAKLLASHSFFNTNNVLANLRTGGDKTTKQEMDSMIASSFSKNKSNGRE